MVLLDMKKARDKALLSDKDEISRYHRHKFDMEYDAIIKTAYEENPFSKTPANKRGRKKKSKVLNLICRLDNYKEYLTIMNCIGSAHKTISLGVDNNDKEISGSFGNCMCFDDDRM